MTAEATRKRRQSDEVFKSNPDVTFENPKREPINLETRKKMTLMTVAKFALFGLILILIMVTVSRFVGDKVISFWYPNRFYPWFGFGMILYIFISILLFPIDYFKDFKLGVQSGLHSMSWVDVVGRWVRKVVVDAISFGLISYYAFLGYFDKFMPESVRIVKHTDYLANSGLIGYLIRMTVPILLIGIIAIPLWLWIRDTLLFFTSYGFKKTNKFDENIAKVRLLGKRYGCTILGTSYYHISGDYTAETKLIGFFGLYFVFLPGTLSGKSAIVASASKALARASGMHGTIKNIVNWFVYGIGIMMSLFGFHLSYKIMYPTYTWPSESAFTADPALVVWILLFMGASFLLAKFINNNIGKSLDKSADKLAEKKGFEKLDGYKRLAELGMGFEDKREPLTNLLMIDKSEPDNQS